MGTDKDLKALIFSLGMRMNHNNNMTSEFEVGFINKSGLSANQHTKTHSKRTRSNLTMLSSQEMQKMDKMILEKEEMETTDHVMEHSQTTKKGQFQYISY